MTPSGPAQHISYLGFFNRDSITVLLCPCQCPCAAGHGRIRGIVAMCISSLELLQDTSDLRLRRWEWELEGSAGRAGAHSCHCTSLQPPAWLMHGDRRDHMLELFPGNCWAPTNHLSLEVPLSADTRHCPHALGTSLRAALAPHGHSCASFPPKTTAELPLPTPVPPGIPQTRGGPQEDSPGINWI